MDKFMRRAVELAVNNVGDGGDPFGAVLVKDGEIISEGVNETHQRVDVTAHAEIQAVRRAQEQLQATSLSGYTMYASGEPCPMCLTAMYFAGITKVYYCAAVEEAFGVGLTKSKIVYEQLTKPKSERTMNMVQMSLEADQINPMKLWQESTSSN